MSASRNASRTALERPILATSSPASSRYCGMPGSAGRSCCGNSRLRPLAIGSIRPIHSTANARLNAVCKYTTKCAGPRLVWASWSASSGSHGNNSTVPSRRISKFPTGRRRATVEPALSTEGNAPPTLAPSTKAMAVTGAIIPAPAREAINSTTATLEWHSQVSNTAATTAMIKSPSRLCMTARNTEVASMWLRVALSKPKASSISPNPISAQPMLS